MSDATRWLEAARAFQQQPEPVLEPDNEPRPGIGPNPVDVAAAVDELESFLTNEDGQAAAQLLQATNQHIVVVVVNEGGGFSTVYALTPAGLAASLEASGTWVAYRPAPAPEITSTTAAEVVRAFSLGDMCNRNPRSILPNIRAGLDRLAEKAMQGHLTKGKVAIRHATS